MSQLTFDTLKFLKTLEKAGIPKEHAEAITSAQKEAFDEMAIARDLATKKDILQVKSELQQIKSELQIEIANVKADLIKWFMGTALAIIGVMVAGFAIVISLIR